MFGMSQIYNWIELAKSNYVFLSCAKHSYFSVLRDSINSKRKNEKKNDSDK